MSQHRGIQGAFWIWTTSLLLALAGCSGDSVTTGTDENLGQTQLALSSEQLRILGFEAPTSDWTTTVGTLAEAPVHSQGQKALAVARPQDWTEVCTSHLSSLGDVGDTLSFDLWMQDTTPTFGEVQVIVRAPSLGLWNNPLPSVNIQQKSAGTFHTISSPLGELSGPLGSSYSDLTLCVAINAEPGTYVLDNLTFSGSTTSTTTTNGSGGTTSTGGTTSSGGTTSTTDGSGGTGAEGGTGGTAGSGGTSGSGGTGGSGGTAGSSGSGGQSGGDLSQCTPESSSWDQLVLRFPQGLGMDKVALGAQGGALDIHDGVAVRTADGSGFANISALDGAGVHAELGVGTETGNVLSALPVTLRSNSTVHGFVKSGGAVTTQTGAQVEETTLENFDHQPYVEVRIPYQFPDTVNPEPSLITNGSNYPLDPGAYGDVSVQAQSTLNLRPGTYYFHSLNLEPGTTLRIDNGAGAVQVFVEGAFSLKVTPEYTAPDEFNVLFAVTGAGPVTLEQNFRGTLLAPLAEIVLPTGDIDTGHDGSVYGRSVTAHQYTDFYFHPYQLEPQDCSVLDPQGLGGVPGCAPKDSDGDGISDCVEENDGNDWTDPNEFNGVRVSLAELCHPDQGLLHQDVDTLEEVDDCLDNASEVEQGNSPGGSQWPAIAGHDICSFEYGLGIQWAECRTRGQIHVEGVVRIDQEGTQCFQVVDGSTANGPNTAVGVLFIDDSAGITALDGAVCQNLSVGIHRVHWFYEFSGRPTHGFRAATCTTTSGSSCNPLIDRDWGGLKGNLIDQLGDGGLTLAVPCAEGQCARQCPCETGGECEADEDCQEGLACGEDNGGHFDQDPTANVCWAGGCGEEIYSTGCGHLTSSCGRCVGISNTCSSDADCAEGKVCGEGNGLHFGLSPTDRVCWPVICETDPQTSCDGSSSIESPCGVCLCEPSCDGKQCGESDGCGGLCPLCTQTDTLESGCQTDLQCAPGLACGPNSVCSNPQCKNEQFFAQNCGADTECGPCLDCEASCEGLECGADPRCNVPCGTCSAGNVCVAGQCVTDEPATEPDVPTDIGSVAGSFAVSSTGAATYTIPIDVPPGRNGHQPALSLVYSTSKEDGPLGLGWKLTGLSQIARCTANKAVMESVYGMADAKPRPVRMNASDFFCLDGEVLIAIDGEYGADGTIYRTERDKFIRIVSHGEAFTGEEYRGPDSFEAKTKDGKRLIFGAETTASVLARPRGTSIKRVWALNQVYDRSNNSMRIRYLDKYTGDSETTELLPFLIVYDPGDRLVRFVYEPRSDSRVATQWVAGNRVRQTQRLARIETIVGNRIVRSYEFAYKDPDLSSPFEQPLLLGEVKECAEVNAIERCKPPTTFHYNAPGEITVGPGLARAYVTGDAVTDVNGDGLDDLRSFYQVFLATGDRTNPFETIDEHVSHPSRLRRFPQERVFDYDHNGTDDFVIGESDSGVEVMPFTIYAQDASGGHEAMYTSFSWGNDPISYMRAVDLNGDSFSDIYTCLDEHTILEGLEEVRVPGTTRIWYSQYVEGEGPTYTEEIVPYLPVFCGGSNNLFVDVDGDGVANVVRQDADTKTWKYLAYGMGPDPSIPSWVDLDLEPKYPSVQGGPDGVYIGSLRPAVYLGTQGADEPLSIRSFNFNRDALPDFLEQREDGQLALWSNTATGLHYDFGGQIDFTSVDWADAAALDIDGDGRDELIIRGKVGEPHVFGERVFQGTDRGLQPSSYDFPSIDRAGRKLIGDFDGDGSRDVMVSGRIWYSNARNAYLLKQVRDGLGLVHTVEYSQFHEDGRSVYEAHSVDCSLSQQICLKRPPPVVSHYELAESASNYPDILKSRLDIEYDYSNLRAGIKGRGIYGFGERDTIEFAPEHEFSRRTNVRYNNESFELAGTIASSEVRTAALGSSNRVSTDRYRVSRSENIWEVRTSDAGRPFPFNKVTTTTVSDYAPSQGGNLYYRKPVYDVRIDRDVDVFGNQIYRNEVVTNPNVQGDRLIRSSELSVRYAHQDDSTLIDRWDVGLPAKRTLRSFYDPADDTPRVANYYYDSLGRLERTTRTDESTGDTVVRLGHDAYGNIELVSREGEFGAVRQELVTYDSQGLFAETVTNGAGETSTMVFDPAFGRIRQFTDPNDLVETYSYDGFGRLTRVDGWKGTIQTTYSDPASAPPLEDPVASGRFAKLRVTTEVSGGTTSFHDLDAFGRTVRAHTYGYFGTAVLQGFSYDWAGNLVSESRPHVPGDITQGVIEYEYNTWRQRVATNFPDDTRVEYYSATPLTYIGSGPGLPSSEQLFSRTSDIAATFVTKRGPTGTLLPIERGTVTDPQGAPQSVVDPDATFTDYYYGSFDQLKRIVHERGAPSGGNETTFDYSAWGYLLHQSDPDWGEQNYQYNPFGEVDFYASPHGVMTSYVYDAAGRRTEQADVIDGNDDPLVTTWEYGTSPTNNNVGRISKATSPDHIVTDYVYYSDANPYSQGLLQTQITSVPRSEGSADVDLFSVGFAYDDFKRIETLSYPEAAGEVFALNYGRDSRGNVTKVFDALDNSLAYWTATDAYQGQVISQERLANDIVTNTTFDALTGRTLDIESQRLGETELAQDITYTYWPDGLMETHRDAAFAPEPEEFQYDALDRLKQVFRPTENPSEPIVHSFDYDRRGNLTSRDGTTLAYDHPGGVLPHAVRSMGDNEYQYDGRGNQTLRIGPDVPGGRQHIDYTPFNLPKSIQTGPEGTAVSTTFEYDADHVRTVKRDAVSNTVFVGGLYERMQELGPDGQWIHKFHVYANGRRVAQVTRRQTDGLPNLPPPEYAFINRDLLGSVHTVSNEFGEILHQQDFTAYGRADRSGLSELGIRLGFTGHEHDDDLGLVDMGGRIYDPALGRFLTPDPIANPYDLQGLNRYSYALDNPVNFVDPSGFEPQEVQGAPQLNQGNVPTAPNITITGISATLAANEVRLKDGSIVNVQGGEVFTKDGERYVGIAQPDGGVAFVPMANLLTGGDSGAGFTDPFVAAAAGALNGASSATGNSSAGEGSGSGSLQNGNPKSGGGSPGAHGGGPPGAHGGGPTADGPRQQGGGPDGPREGQSGSFASRAGHFAMGLIPIVGSLWTMHMDPYATDSDKGFALISFTIEAGTFGAASLETKVIRIAHGVSTMCFAPGTPVMTPDGLVPIEQLREGDLVLSQSDTTGEIAYKRITRTFETPDKPVIELAVTDTLGHMDALQVTPEHPFWVDGQGWVPANELTAGQTFGSASGSWLRVKGSTWTNIRTTVYNLEVEDFHTYFVGEGGLWVHNTCGGLVRAITRIAPGSLPEAEEAAVKAILKHIDEGTKPAGSLAKKWGAKFKNWADELPGPKGPASPYREYRVPPSSGTGAGTNRIVANGDASEVYYTWTHYGDMGVPSFVRIR